MCALSNYIFKQIMSWVRSRVVLRCDIVFLEHSHWLRNGTNFSFQPTANSFHFPHSYFVEFSNECKRIKLKPVKNRCDRGNEISNKFTTCTCTRKYFSLAGPNGALACDIQLAAEERRRQRSKEKKNDLFHSLQLDSSTLVNCVIHSIEICIERWTNRLILHRHWCGIK